MLFLNLLI